MKKNAWFPSMLMMISALMAAAFAGSIYFTGSFWYGPRGGHQVLITPENDPTFFWGTLLQVLLYPPTPHPRSLTTRSSERAMAVSFSIVVSTCAAMARR